MLPFGSAIARLGIVILLQKALLKKTFRYPIIALKADFQDCSHLPGADPAHLGAVQYPSGANRNCGPSTKNRLLCGCLYRTHYQTMLKYRPHTLQAVYHEP